MRTGKSLKLRLVLLYHAVGYLSSFLKITSQLRSNTDLALLTKVMNLLVLAEITNNSHSLQYIYTAKSGGKSVRTLIQPDRATNWFERSLEMPIVHMNYALRQFDFHCLSYKYFMLDSSILDIRLDIYAMSIQDNCKNRQNHTI